MLTHDGITAELWSDPVVAEVLSALPASEQAKIKLVVDGFIVEWCSGVIGPVLSMSTSGSVI